MKIQKKIFTLSMSLLILCGAVTSVSAISYKLGSVYNTVTHKDIPAWGEAHTDTYYGSQKVTTEPLATFIKTHGDAALGNYGGLITSSKNQVSNIVGLPLNKATSSAEHGCTKGTIYFTVVTSAAIEPSNTCDVTMKFSADNLR